LGHLSDEKSGRQPPSQFSHGGLRYLWCRRAIKYHEKAFEIDRQIGDRPGKSNALLWNLSVALDTLGERVQSSVHPEATLKIYEELDHRSAAKVRKQLAAWRER
jgi:hypothetical protein